VKVAVGGGVFDGKGVIVGVSVNGASVADGVMSDSVGVCVGTPEGRLQADRAKIRTVTDIKARDFISLSFWFIILYKNPEDDNSPVIRNP
jgi:hypothetical protein